MKAPFESFHKIIGIFEKIKKSYLQVQLGNEISHSPLPLLSLSLQVVLPGPSR